MQPLVHGTTLEYWANKVERVLIPSRHRERYAIPSMKLYWKRLISTFEGYVNSQEVNEVVIGPPLRELSSNTRLIPNTRAASAWATRQNLGFAEWRADLNGWVVHGGDVPMEWSEKNIIAKALESISTTSAPKRPRGKSASFEDKPKKVRRQRTGVEKSKAGSPKPSAVAQSSSGAAPATKSSVPAAASASSSSPLKQYRRKTNAGRVQILKTLEEVSSQNPYLLTPFLSFFAFSFLLCLPYLVLTTCLHGCNNLTSVKRYNQRGMILRVRLLTLVNYFSLLQFLLAFSRSN